MGVKVHLTACVRTLIHVSLLITSIINIDSELFVDLKEHFLKRCDGHSIAHDAKVFEVQIELTEELSEVFSDVRANLEGDFRGHLGQKLNFTEVTLEVRLNHSVGLFRVLDHGDLVARAKTSFQEE